MPAQASAWVGTADYTKAPGIIGNLAEEAKTELVGPFDKYDFGTGVVLLESVASCVSGASCYDGYYQSFVTNHELTPTPLTSTKLNNSYEVTVTANFSEVVTSTGVSVTGGQVKLWLDMGVDRNFAGDTGFSDGYNFLSGTIVGGAGTVSSFGALSFGATVLEIRVDSYDTAIFEPDTIVGGDGIFTLRLNFPSDASFINSVNSVQSHTYNAGSDLKFTADGYVDLAAAPIPEMDQYALMLLGFGLTGVLARKRNQA
ncbi:MAG: hypothetical protein B7Y41_15615 [Hydrogenophilales bacterium 28-61-23]|nr:MAG: hypothetical protein B7Y41_15615 [Hydrogenophilales bacterium 28-61-23]